MKMNSLCRELEKELEDGLVKQHGLILTGEPLRKALGYPSMAAFRKALSRGTIPIPVFPMRYRRGKYALVKDVVHWLVEQRNGVLLEK